MNPPHHGYGIQNSRNDGDQCSNPHLSAYQYNNSYNLRESQREYNRRCAAYEDNTTDRHYYNTNSHGYSKTHSGKYSSYDGRNFNSYYNSVILSSSCEDVSRIGTGASMSPRCKYSIRLKLKVVEYAQKFSIHKTARQFRIDRKTVRDWRGQEVQLRLKLKLEKVDDEVLVFYRLQQEKKLPVSREDLKMKATEVFRQMVQEGVALADEFEANDDWVTKFVKRYKLNVDQTTDVLPDQKAPVEYVDEFLDYLIDKQKLPVPCPTATTAPTKDSNITKDKDQYKIENLK